MAQRKHNFTFLTAAYVERWRKQREIPRSEMGQAMGYRNGGYIKKIELGCLPITSQFAYRFQIYKRKTQLKEKRSLQSRYPLPPRLKILARPHRCKYCREWFIFPNDNERVCTARECQRMKHENKKHKTVRQVKMD